METASPRGSEGTGFGMRTLNVVTHLVSREICALDKSLNIPELQSLLQNGGFELGARGTLF